MHWKWFHLPNEIIRNNYIRHCPYLKSCFTEWLKSQESLSISNKPLQFLHNLLLSVYREPKTKILILISHGRQRRVNLLWWMDVGCVWQNILLRHCIVEQKSLVPFTKVSVKIAILHVLAVVRSASSYNKKLYNIAKMSLQIVYKYQKTCM